MVRTKETTFTFDLTPSKLAEIRKVLDIPVGLEFKISTTNEYGLVYLSEANKLEVEYTIREKQ